MAMESPEWLLAHWTLHNYHYMTHRHWDTFTCRETYPYTHNYTPSPLVSVWVNVFLCVCVGKVLVVVRAAASVKETQRPFNSECQHQRNHRIGAEGLAEGPSGGRAPWRKARKDKKGPKGWHRSGEGRGGGRRCSRRRGSQSIDDSMKSTWKLHATSPFRCWPLAKSFSCTHRLQQWGRRFHLRRPTDSLMSIL